MAKKDSLHPSTRIITVQDSKGNHYKVMSTNPSEVLKLDIDTHTHPAWTNQAGYVDTNVNAVASFNKRYENLNF